MFVITAAVAVMLVTEVFVVVGITVVVFEVATADTEKQVRFNRRFAWVRVSILRAKEWAKSPRGLTSLY